MKIKVLIVEDNAITSEDLSEMLTDYGMEIIGVAKSADSAKELISNSNPDVLLVDIKLKGNDDGIALVHSLEYTLPVVYLSSNTDSDTLKLAFASNPSSFLSKPFNEQDLCIAIELAFNKYLSGKYKTKQKVNNFPGDFIFIKTGKEFEKVQLDKILYLEADGSYTKVHIPGRFYLSAKNLSYFSEHLNSEQFIRIHRSYSVNIHSISKIDGKQIFVEGQAIPIGRAYKDNLKHLKNHFL